MFKVVYGKAASGKTTYILENIKNDILSGKQPVLIVPEQFTFECERALLNLVGDGKSGEIPVLSFSRLALNIQRLLGGMSEKVLEDFEKVIFIHKSLRLIKDELLSFKRFAVSPRFAVNMADMIGELKISAISPEEISCISKKIEDTVLKNKLHDISMIYSTYNTLIESKYTDPTDKLTLLFEQLKSAQFFKNKNVYIDSFKGFTGQQYKVIEQILLKADNVTLSICLDDVNKNKTNIFENTRETVKKIEKICEKNSIPLGEYVRLDGSYYTSPALKAVESYLAGEKTDNTENDGTVNIIHAANLNDEATFVARKIRNLVRTENYRYRDFVVIARDTAPYESVIENECLKNKVFCYCDKKVALSDMPIYKLIVSALDCAKRLNSKSILEFLKTGLTDIEFSDICELENYVYLWNIDGKKWNDEWNMNLSGLTVTDIKPEEKKIIERINATRKKTVELLNGFKSSVCDGTKNKAEAVYNLIVKSKADKNLQKLSADLPDGYSIDDKQVLVASYDKMISLIDSLNECLDADCTLREFTEIFKLGCSICMIGKIPQMLDEVTFGDADRIRPSRPKIAFIMGANEGVFPAFPENTTMLSNSERDKLIKLGLNIKNKAYKEAIDENLLVYTCVCCATDKVYISYNDGLSNEESMPSDFIDGILSIISSLEVVDTEKGGLKDENYPETERAVFDFLCDSREKPEFSTFLSILEDKENYKEKIKNIELAELRKPNRYHIESKNAIRLFGKDITLSASKFDVYHQCKFRYFINYGLRIRKMQPAADLDVLQRGTIVHYALEKFVENHKADIKNIGTEGIYSEICGYVDEWFSKIVGADTLMTPRFLFLIKCIKNGITDVAKRLAAEFAQSDFLPAFCEFPIGEKEDGIKFTVDAKTGRVTLEGSIDRVDRWLDKVRIIDYKTGSKEFKLSSTLFGLNMQMIIYLYAALSGENSPVKNLSPAGVLYLHANRNLKKEDEAMHGLLTDDDATLYAMQKDKESKFIPVKNSRVKRFISEDKFKTLFDYSKLLMKEMCDGLHAGDISAIPVQLGTKSGCDYCDFESICNIEDGERKECNASDSDVFLRMEEKLNNA